MFLVELVLQGVRGIRELARLRFQSGFNFIAAGNESGKTTSVDAMQRLLFPRNQPGLMDALVSKHTPDASRAALVMFSDDGSYYRIIQDCSKKAVNLSKYNTAGKDFGLLYKDWDSTVQFMSGLTNNIAEADFARVFLFRRDHYAQASQPGTSQSGPAPIPRAQPRSAAPAKASANQARLAELREQLKKAEEAADAEYRAQTAKLALDDIRKKLTAIEETEQKNEEITSTLENLKGCESLPEDLSELIEAHERRQGQKAADADELNRELESLKMQMDGVPSVNLFTDKLFIAGAALGVLSIVAGMFLITEEMQHYFPLALLLSVGLMAGAWYNGSRKGAQRSAFRKEVAALEKEIAEIDKRFEQEGASIKACMKSTGATSTADLKERADNYRYFLSLRTDMEEQRHRVLGDHTPEALQQEYERLQQESLELEKEARLVAMYNVDTYSIRQDIERLEGESASVAETSWDLGSELQELPTDFAGASTAGGRAGFHAELACASRIGEIEMETLVPAVEAAAQRNLAAASNGRYVRIEVGSEGGSPVVHAKDDSVVNATELSHGTRDLIYFCLRTGLVEALAGKNRLPFIIDDALTVFDPARQKSACQILRSLGAKTQVILFTSNPALRAEGDIAAELK